MVQLPTPYHINFYHLYFLTLTFLNLSFFYSMIEIESCFFQLSISTTIAIASGAPDLNQFIENIIRPQKIYFIEF